LEDRVDVSVILCAYNEGNVIEDAIDRVNGVMMGTGWNYEIVVVDDGSSDDTRQKAFRYVNERSVGQLKIISYEENLGKGNAIRTGFIHSRGDIVVVIDSDLDVDARLIPSYVEALKMSDIAVASKWHPESRTAVTLKRKILSFGFNALSRLFTGIKLKDTQTGLKAFRKEVLDRMAPKFVVKRFAFDLELIGACNHAGYRIVDLPVNVNIKSMVSFKEIFRMTLDMFGIAYRLRVLKYYQRS
jgi:glycosyltransferase involved in cell wall biosynthesis